MTPTVIGTPPPMAQPQFMPQPVGFGAPPPAAAPQWTPPAQPAPQWQPPAGAQPPVGFQPQPAPQGFAQPQPGPAPAGQAGQYTLQAVLPLMQKYIATFKAPGAMAAFAKFGLPPTLPQLDQNGLNTMGAFFAAMQPA